MQQWLRRLEEIKREATQFRVGVRGEVAQAALHARMHYEVKHWLILTDWSDAFNTVERPAGRTEKATCVPALTTFEEKCYGKNVHQCSSRWTRGKGVSSTAPVS